VYDLDEKRAFLLTDQHTYSKTFNKKHRAKYMVQFDTTVPSHDLRDVPSVVGTCFMPICVQVVVNKRAELSLTGL
jgi:hypothetical protein